MSCPCRPRSSCGYGQSLGNESGGTRFERLRLALLFREAQRLGPQFDLCITAENFGAFNRAGIQYVHYPVTFRPDTGVCCAVGAALLRRL